MFKNAVGHDEHKTHSYVAACDWFLDKYEEELHEHVRKWPRQIVKTEEKGSVRFGNCTVLCCSRMMIFVARNDLCSRTVSFTCTSLERDLPLFLLLIGKLVDVYMGQYGGTSSIVYFMCGLQGKDLCKTSRWPDDERQNLADQAVGASRLDSM